ncbi:MAG: formate dehydrogenase subunit delta [Halieaceae bacterium]|nr:formate dehydrogenase subunit delta [Halieaceae bacterium]
MTDTQVQHLVKMAQQIALNMAAEGDGQVDKTAAHIRKFWTPAMREELVEHARAHRGELSAELQQVVEALGESD